MGQKNRDLCRQQVLGEKSGKGASKEVSEADLAEFKLLENRITDADAAAYVKHRAEFFGSTEAYQEFAAKSDKELEDNEVLHKLVDYEGEREKVFYRWVRKAYHNEGITDVPGLIKRGSSKELRDALVKVKKGYGKDFKFGGFNPRPKKTAKYELELGTISEHAFGNAVDVEDKRNPILTIEDWKFIQKLVGKTVNRAPSRWEKDPEALWKDVKELNDLFVAKVAEEVERIKSENAAANQAETDPKSKGKGKRKREPIDIVLGDHTELKKWVGGFFTLDWALVEQFHSNGFVWGVIFTTKVDLHHFQLKE